MLPTKMHMARKGAVAMRFINETPVSWKRATVCGKYLRLELTTTVWAKVTCKMCLKAKRAKK